MANKTHVIKQNDIYVTKIEDDKGIIGAVVNVYGIVDLGGDRTNLGMFKKSIQEAFPKGKIKVLDNHKTDSITDILGKPIAMRELNRNELPNEITKRYPEATGGLYTETQYNLNTSKGRDAFHLIKEGMVTEYSIGFYLYDYDITQEGNKSIRDIKTGHLLEYSPVLWGMNQATATTSVKNDETPDDSDNDFSLEAIEEEEQNEPDNGNNGEMPKSLPANDSLFPFRDIANGDDLLEAIADLLSNGDEGYRKARASKRIEKRLAHSMTDSQLKNISLYQIERAVAMQFYRLFDTNTESYWVKDVFDSHLLVEQEFDPIVGRFYQVNYSINTNTMSVTFEPKANWIEGRMIFSAHDFTTPPQEEETPLEDESETESAGQLQSDAIPTEEEKVNESHRLEVRRQDALKRALSLSF